ncbi:MerR family transcriptional regulator [Kordiimonas aquimaris]|uniref:MerR family transcriptional regulator n=1 Tax=Kordiimonas aquimaris TaxID=707591 RepID=UPI0021D0AF23|nr:MerR family transcriptional regulator [Kordiimonas aquimaris]
MVLKKAIFVRIGEVVKKAGVGPDTIRFYERQGLIQSLPSKDKTNTYRNYPEETLQRIAMIKQAQHAGFSIAEFSALIETIENPSADFFDADIFLQKKIDEIEERMRHARKFLKTLRATKNALSLTRS